MLLSPDYNVACEGGGASGVFDAAPETPIIQVGIGGREKVRWLATLAHEFSHACQWAENAPVWRESFKGDCIWKWLNGGALKNPEDKVVYLRELEADCERRTIRLLKELRSPVDLALYSRGANAYVHFYNIIPETRKWYAKGKGPYEVPEVLAQANPTMDLDFSKTPSKLRRELLKCV